MHHVNVCEWGFVHGQCRCPAPNKVVNRISCPTPDYCRVKTENPPYTALVSNYVAKHAADG